MKVVINTCYGGFGLSNKALDILLELDSKFVARSDDGVVDIIDSYNHDLRTDDKTIQVVEQLGEASWGQYAELKIVDVPEDVHWEIEEYDGNEEVREVSRRWS